MKTALAAILAVGMTLTGPAFAQVVQSGPTVTFTPSGSASSAAAEKLDYEHAIPMPMPTVSGPGVSPTTAQAKPTSTGAPGFSPGSPGTGQQRATKLFSPRSDNVSASPQEGAVPQEYGSSLQQYTTSRVNAYNQPTSQYYPFSPAGKLYFKIGSSTYVCSASLIKRGIVVTAAHCVANFGKSQLYSGWQFIPAFNNGTAPFGTWNAKNVTLMTSYYNGSDACYQTGVICQNDVALINLLAQNGSFAGDYTGTFGYGWNGYGTSNGNTLVTQLGYPVALDSGVFMERTDSQGFKSTLANNTIIGSLQTGGSSGGPWVVNLGRAPLLNGVSYGNAALHNIVVGVTSWGYTNSAIKQQGASPFTDGNITVLVNVYCGPSGIDRGHC